MAIDAVEYKIVADESPATRAFQRMEKAYAKTLRRMSGDNRQFEKRVESSFRKVTKTSEKSAKKTRSAWKSSFTFIKGQATAVARRLAQDMASAVLKVAGNVQKLSAEFESGMAAVSTLIDEKGMAKLDGFAEALGKMSREGDQTVQTLAKAAYQAISATGATLEDTKKIVKQADLMATAGQSTTDIAVKALVQVKNAWGEGAGTFRDISDVLFQTVKKGVTNFPLLASNIGKVAPVAAIAGIELKETLGTFAAITKVIPNTSTAMVSLKSLITQILSPSKKAADNFNKLGIDFGAAALKSKGLSGVLADISKKTEGNATALRGLFPNIRAFQAAAALTGKQLKRYGEILKSVQGSSGATQTAFEKMAATWTFQSARFKNILNSVYRDLFADTFDEMNTILQRTNDALSKNESKVRAWSKGTSEALSEVALSTVTLGKALGTIWQTLKDNTTAFQAFMGAILTLTGIPFLTSLIKKNNAEMRKQNQLFKEGLALQKKLAAAEKERIASLKKREGFLTSFTGIGTGTDALRKRLTAIEKAQQLHDSKMEEKRKQRAAKLKKERDKALKSAKAFRLKMDIALLSGTAPKILSEKDIRAPIQKNLQKMADEDVQRQTDIQKMSASDDALSSQLKAPTQAVSDATLSFQILKDELSKTFGSETLATVGAWWGQFTGLGAKGAKSFVTTVQSTLGSFISGLGAAWSDMISGMVQGQDDSKEMFLASLLDLVSQMASAWGSYLLALVPAYIAVFNYPGAILAGIGAAAMFAIAGLSSGAAGGMRSAAQSKGKVESASRAGESTGRSAQAFQNDQKPDAQSRNITINVGYMAPPNQQEMERFAKFSAEALNQGKNVVGNNPTFNFEERRG